MSRLEDAPQFKACLERAAGQVSNGACGGPCAMEAIGERVIVRRASTERSFGRDPKQDVVLIHARVAPLHAVAASLGGQDCWLADAGSAERTFVNREPIVARRLASGDLVQIGPYGWVFNATQGMLEPVAGVQGLSLECVEAAVAGRLHPFNLSIAAGQLIALIGESGSGKSTLAKLLCDQPGLRTGGKVLADGRDIRAARDWFRQRLGYVSQDEAVHRDLTPWEAVEFACRLRGGDPCDVESLLNQVDLGEDRWERPISSLSGGEAKRVRIAAELANLPGLLVLDEAASGLDWEREKSLTRLLRTLSHRGCTVVNVTHNLRQLDAFSRITVVREGRIAFDGSPTQLRGLIPSGDLSDIELHTVGGDGSRLREKPGRGEGLRPEFLRILLREVLRFCRGRCATRALSGAEPVEGPAALAQTRLLLTRELTIMSKWWCLRKRLLVPLVFLPLFFAAVLACAVKPDNTTMLGFLAILSCIWMGASATLMAIVDEREVFDHERMLFLRVGPYVVTKTLLGWLAALVQTLVFVALLTLLRLAARGADAPPNEPLVFREWAWALWCLVLVGMAGAGVGLLISAVAGRQRPIANFLLPLVMIAQIVFSVQIAAPDTAKEALEICYGEFHFHQCASGRHAQGRRAERWFAETTPPSGDTGAATTAGWLCGDCSIDGARGAAPDPDDDRRLDAMRPNLFASLASYLTISRYGDIALRSFAYFPAHADDARRFSYRRWRWEALLALTALTVGFPLATAAVLSLSNFGGLGRAALSTLKRQRDVL
ncbi:MAG TPA: ATP-binding cassette domain-containing protein [Pirellulales bacterium]